MMTWSQTLCTILFACFYHYTLLFFVEHLAKNMRQNKAIIGISVQGKQKTKKKQFADAAAIIINCSKEYFTAALQDLE